MDLSRINGKSRPPAQDLEEPKKRRWRMKKSPLNEVYLYLDNLNRIVDCSIRILGKCKRMNGFLCESSDRYYSKINRSKEVGE